MDTRSPRFDAGEAGAEEDGGAQGFGEAADEAMGQARSAFADASRHVAEIKAYAAHYMTAKVDGLKLSARKVLLYAVMAVVLMIAGAGVIAAAGALVMVGFAHALGALFRGTEWAGDLIAGGVVLGGLLGAAYIALTRMMGTSKVKTVGKYEQFERRQREQFGTDVHERAGEQHAGGN